MDDSTDPRQIIDYWFGPLTDGLADAAHRHHWFAASADRDAEIAARFGPLLEKAGAGELDHWLESPQDTVAFIIVTDQFSRQIHRGTAQAYALDGMALAAARQLVADGLDGDLEFDERAFAYMPFQHAESRVDQHLAVGLYGAMRENATTRENAGPHHEAQADGYLGHAREHRNIVLRFGRFPHRNALLGRASTAAEQAFLESAGNYGQAPAGRR
jgi:uncharacterized protein (DUF924 family)